MTDYEQIEQKAKKYVNDKADTGNYDYALGDNVLFGKSALEKAYIAGAKENGVVWHDLRKDPNDLPNVEGGWVCNQDGYPCFFDWHTEQWLDTEGTQITTVEWCNIPHISQIRSDYV